MTADPVHLYFVVILFFFFSIIIMGRVQIATDVQFRKGVRVKMKYKVYNTDCVPSKSAYCLLWLERNVLY